MLNIWSTSQDFSLTWVKRLNWVVFAYIAKSNLRQALPVKVT